MNSIKSTHSIFFIKNDALFCCVKNSIHFPYQTNIGSLVHGIPVSEPFHWVLICLILFTPKLPISHTQ